MAPIWPGGIYATPGIAGSRTGVYIASAWVSMMKMGIKGFKENARILNKSKSYKIQPSRHLPTNLKIWDFMFLESQHVVLLVLSIQNVQLAAYMLG